MSRIFWKRVISGMQLAEGYKIPRGWGVSYIRWDADFYIIHPIPFNYIVAGTRWLLFKLQIPWFVNKEKERVLGKYLSKWEDRYLSGWHDGWDEYKRHEGKKWEDFIREAMEIIQREDEETKRLDETNKPDGL